MLDTRGLTAAGGTLLGAIVGALIAWSGASALGPSGEGAGYGGTAGRLQVVVVGESVHVSGSGFLASSDVVVSVGSLHTTVVADEFGTIDTVLNGSADQSVVASGQSPTGAPTTARPAPEVGAPSAPAVMVGAGIGACPALLRSRRRRGR